jgi:hypothetical protein
MFALLAESLSLAMKLYAVQELLVAPVLFFIPVAVITVVLATAVLAQEAGRSGIRWWKTILGCSAGRTTDTLRSTRESPSNPLVKGC